MRYRSLKLTCRRANSSLVSASFFSCALVACAAQDRSSGPPPELGEVSVSAEPIFSAASTPNLAAGPDGTVYLSWSERVDSTSYALRFASLNADGWSKASDITRGRPLFVNWADFPSLTVLENGDLVSHWLEREGEGTYAYGVRIARSRDGGASWDSALTPHADGLLAEHGFVTLWPAGGDALGAVWLDGRKTAMRDSAREMTIRTAVIGRETVTVPEVLLDSRACDCCQTSAARARAGQVIVYRDRSDAEIRDIAIVREVDGQWTEPSVVFADNWHFDACPVNGPSVAAMGDTVVVAWFTGAQDTARVRVSMSTDGGATFGAPVRVDDGDPIGRVSVVLDNDARPVVMWMERTSADSSEVRIRRLGDNGLMSAATTITTVAGSRRSGFPRMVRSRQHLHFAWTVPGEPMQVRVGSAALQR